MNKLLIAAILSLGTTAAFAGGGGEVSRNDQVVGQKSRAEVVAELRNAVAAGLLKATAEGETAQTPVGGTVVASRTRAEVQAEARRFGGGANATLSVPSGHKGS